MGPFQTISTCQESVHDFWENFTKLKTMTGEDCPTPRNHLEMHEGRQFSFQLFDLLQDPCQTHGTDVKNVILVNHFSSSHLLKVVVQPTWSYANSHSIPKNQGHSKIPKVYKVMLVKTQLLHFALVRISCRTRCLKQRRWQWQFFKRETGQNWKIALLWIWSNLATRIFVNDSLKYRGISWVNEFFWAKIQRNASPELVPVFLSKLRTEKTFCHATSLHTVRKTSLQPRNLVSPLAISIPKIWYRVPQNPWFPTITICIQKVITFGKIIDSKYLIWQVTRTLFIQTPSSFCKTNIQPKPPCKHVINNDQWINCTQFHRVKNINEPGITFYPNPKCRQFFFRCFAVGEWDLPPSPLCLVARVIFFQNQFLFSPMIRQKNIVYCGCEASWIQVYTKFTTCQSWFTRKSQDIFRFGAWSIRTVYCSFSIPSLRLWIACGMGFRWWSPRPRPW